MSNKTLQNWITVRGRGGIVARYIRQVGDVKWEIEPRANGCLSITLTNGAITKSAIVDSTLTQAKSKARKIYNDWFLGVFRGF